ncbi:MAG: hypothetical protein V1811_00930 [Candidatus Micrarchaeota archaeon]
MKLLLLCLGVGLLLFGCTTQETKQIVSPAAAAELSPDKITAANFISVVKSGQAFECVFVIYKPVGLSTWREVYTGKDGVIRGELTANGGYSDSVPGITVNDFNENKTYKSVPDGGFGSENCDWYYHQFKVFLASTPEEEFYGNVKDVVEEGLGSLTCSTPSFSPEDLMKMPGKMCSEEDYSEQVSKDIKAHFNVT